MRVVIYARLSKKKKKQSKKIEVQLSIAKRYADEQNWEVVATFYDDDISASRFRRKEREDYPKLLEYLKTNPVDIVLVTEMPRLYRDVGEVLVLTTLAERGKIRLKIVATEGDEYDLTTPEGIHRAIGAVNNAKLEAEKTSKREKRIHGEEAKQGMMHSGRRCYGFEPGYEEHREEEAKRWRAAFERALDGELLYRVQKDCGITTAKGLPISRRNLQKMLLRPAYAGFRDHLGVLYPSPIIKRLCTPEERDRLILVFAAAGANRKHRGQPRRHPLTGHLTCGHCGNNLTGAMRFSRKSGQSQAKASYYCQPDSEHRGCGKIQRQAAPLEDFVYSAIEMRIPDGALDAYLAEQQDDNGELAALMGQQQEKQFRLNNLIDEYYGSNPDGLTKEQFRRAKTAAESSLAETEKSLQAATVNTGAKRLRAVSSISTILRGNDIDQISQVLSLLIEEIIVHPMTKRPKYKEWVFDPDAIEIRWRC